MNIVIVGAGLAGATAAEELREQGYDGELVLVGAEAHLPYERPPLSKDLLLGKGEESDARVHDADWYADHRVELVLDTPVTAIDLANRTVTTADRELPYDRLLLATGASSRGIPPLEDAARAAGAHVAHLRTLDDARAIKERLHGRVVVVGAGWIGLEVASAARQQDADVVVLEKASQPLAGVLGERLGAVFADLHREHGVDLRLGQDADPAVFEGANLVLIAAGATPNDQLAREAGLACDDGVLVDATLRTSDPHVWAVGDVAGHDHPTLGRLRVEHWDNAIHQAKAAARAMLAADGNGAAEPYDRQPYFFTDQYDLGMEYIGHHGPDDELVVDGDTEKRELIAWWLRDGVVVAGMHLNDWDAADRIRAQIGRPLDRS